MLVGSLDSHFIDGFSHDKLYLSICMYVCMFMNMYVHECVCVIDFISIILTLYLPMLLCLVVNYCASVVFTVDRFTESYNIYYSIVDFLYLSVLCLF